MPDERELIWDECGFPVGAVSKLKPESIKPDNSPTTQATP